MMINLLKTFVLGTSSLLSASVLAHSGHGEHAVSMAAGGLHSMLGAEHLVLVSVALLAYLITKRA